MFQIQQACCKDNSSAMDADGGFSDLLQQAQQLKANMDTGEALPRVERNLVQIRETAAKLAYRTPYCGVEGSDVKAWANVLFCVFCIFCSFTYQWIIEFSNLNWLSQFLFFSSLLLSTRGYDVHKVIPKLESLSSAKTFEPLEAIRDTDIQVWMTLNSAEWLFILL